MKNILYIITPSQFLDCFTDFIIHKQSLGFIVNTYMVENIGNGTFNDIKAFLDGESEKIKDDYYVILGGNHKCIPSETNRKGRYVDSSYAQTADKRYWRIVGRFPTDNEDEMRELCANAIRYEEHFVSYKENLLMIAATKRNIDKAKTIAGALKTQFASVGEIYTNREGKQEVLDQLNANVSCFINYMGHGNSGAWALKLYGNGRRTESVKSTEIPQFTIPVHILSWACSTANVKKNKCLGTEFLMKGAVSFWGACSLSYGGANRFMAEKFWDIYASSCCLQHLGEIYLQIYKDCLGVKKGCKQYMLLGDPTLKIR